MLLGVVGRLLKAVAKLRTGDARRDLQEVGDELVRLDRRRPQRPVISR